MKTRSSDFQLYARILREARPYWVHLAGIFAISLIATPLALLTPLPLKIAVDSVVGSQPPPACIQAIVPRATGGLSFSILMVASILVVGISLLSHFQGLANSLLCTYTGEKLVLTFRSRLFRHLQRLSLSYHDAKGAAHSVYQVHYDSRAIQYITIDGVIPFITALLTLTMMLYVSFRLDWQLALVALSVSPVLFALGHAYRSCLRDQWHEAKSLESSALGVVQEVLSALRVVKAFGQEQREQERFAARSSKSVSANIKVAFTEGGLGLLLGLTTATGTAIVLFIGIRHVIDGSLTLGNLLLIIAYIAQLYGPLSTMSRKVATLQAHLASAERAFTVLDEAPDVIERPNARPLHRAQGAVEFRHVSFVYEKGYPVLRDLSLQVPKGSRVGIAGRTGAGKTTLLNLLTRFYDPTEGHILLDGVDLRDYKLADLRNQFAIVLQEPVLFSTTIAENIAYGRVNATSEEIIEAAKAANAHEFIAASPNGYDTQVGERGMRLSGGERQRISLARAFLKDAPILILDEPTSSVDLKTEATIMEAMERLMKGRTTFLIAHRLSTLADCDMRLELEEGRLAIRIPGVTSGSRPAAMHRDELNV